LVAFVKRRPVVSGVIAVLVVLAVLSFVLPYVGGGGGGITTVP
jgi:preprotein translocase subunit SecE